MLKSITEWSFITQIIRRAALHWTNSLKGLSEIISAQSRLGLTKDLYIVSKLFLDRIKESLFIKLITLLRNFRCHVYEKNLYMACLLGSRLNNSFHWKAHLPILFKLLLSWVLEKVSPLTFEKSDVLPSSISRIDSIPLGKPFI